MNLRPLRLDEERRIHFSCLYVARVFAGWGGWSPKWVQWFGACERTPELDDSCEHCGEHLQQIATGADAEERWREIRAHRATGPPLTLIPECPGDVVDVPFAELDPPWFAEARPWVLRPDLRLVGARRALRLVEAGEAAQAEGEA